ncbi:MAG: hypothetical protein ACE5QV_04715 [Fidelibacterota bacterium]
MAEKAGIFREERGLKEGLERVKELQERYRDVRLKSAGRRLNFELMWTLELKGNLDVAEAILVGALTRKESRGSQFRRDYPTRDDKNWLKHTLAYYTDRGPELKYSKVDLSLFEPKERKY